MMKNRQGYKKLYKSGKLWIAVSSGLLFLGTAVLTDQTQIVQADTLTPTQQTHATAVVANTAEPTTTTPQAVATAVAQPTPVEPRTVALQTTVNTSLGIKTVAITGTTGSTITVNAPIVAGYTADQPTLSATINVAGTIATINSNPYITYTPTTASTQPAMAGTDTTSAPVTTIATKTASVDATAAQSATAKTTDKPTTQPNATIDQDQAVSDTKIAKTTSDDSKAINDQETHDLSGSYQKDSLTSNQPQLASRSNDDVSFHEIYFDGTTGDNTSGSSNASDISGITPGPTDITSAVFWGYAVDINTSDYLGHPEAQLTINPSVPNSMSLTSVTNIGSPSYWESAGFTDNVEVIFTTTNGQTDTQKIVAGQSDYVATVGSASDPVVSVTIRSVDAVRPPGSRGTWNAHQVFLYHATFYTKDPVTVQYHLNGTIKDAADKIMRTHEKWLTINYGYGPAITLWQDRSTLPGTFIWSDVTNYTGKSIKYASPGQTIYFSDNLLSLASAGVTMGKSSPYAPGQNEATYATYVQTHPDALGGYVRIPKGTTFAGEDALRKAWWRHPNVTVQTFTDKNGDTVLYISHLNYENGRVLAELIPVIVDSNLALGTQIKFNSWDFAVRPDAAIFRPDATQLTRGISYQDDWNNGNVYHNSSQSEDFTITINDDFEFSQSTSIKGSSDIIDSHTAKVDMTNPTAIVTQNLHNGLAVNRMRTTVNLVDNTGQHLYLTAPVKILNDIGQDISGDATITYLDSAGQATTFDKAASVKVNVTSPASKTLAKLVYETKLADGDIKSSVMNKTYQVFASAIPYNDQGQPTSTTDSTTLTVIPTRQVTDTWQVLVKDANGNFTLYNAGQADKTTSGLAGSAYSSATPYAKGDIIDKNYTVTDVLDAKGNVIDPTTLQYTDTTLDKDGNPTGNTYQVVVTANTETVTKKITYTVNFQGAGDQTPAPITKTVTWTGVINSASNGIELRSADANASGVWTPDTTDIAVDVPEIAGYTADKTKVFTDPLAQTTTEPTDQTVTVTYTKIDTNVTTKVNFVDENNEVVGSIDKTGEANTTVDVAADVPAGYTAVDPTTVTLTDAGIVNITVKKDAPVETDVTTTVNFVDETTGKAIKSVTKTGKADDKVDVAADLPTGYTTVDPTTVTLTKDGVVNIKVKQEAPVEADVTTTVNFVDESNVVVGSTVKTGKDGDKVDVSADVPAGYTAVDPTTIALSKNGVVNIKVEKKAPVETDVTTTVNFVDETTKQPIKTVEKTGKDGDMTDVAADVPVDYTAVDPTTITLSKAGIVNITVKKDAPVETDVTTTVNFVDENKAVVGSTIKTGKDGDKVDVFADVPTGYTAVDPTTVTLAKDGVINITVKKDAPVEADVATNVDFVNENGDTIHSVTVAGKPGSTVDVNGNVPTGYDATSSTIVTITKDGKAIVHVKKQQTTPTVEDVTTNVDFVDENSNTIHSVTLTGKPGSTVDVIKDVPKGYDPTSSTTISITKDGKAIVHVKKQQTTPPAEDVSTKVDFVDEYDNTVHSMTVTGKSGSTVDVNGDVPAGYDATSSTIVTIIKDGKAIVHIKKHVDTSKPTTPTVPTKPTDPSKPTTPTDPTKPTDPSKPTTPTDPTKPTDPTTPTTTPATPQPTTTPSSNGVLGQLVNTANSNSTGTPNHDKDKQTPTKATGLTSLPQTGEAKQIRLQMLGVGVLGFATLAGLIALRRKRQDKASKSADKK